MTNINHNKNSGFSLIQLAMVLVGVGLLIGGIMTGQSLLRSSQIQSVINDVDRYKKATQMFKEKYNYLPGDTLNASSFWTGATNGNGDGFIGDSNGTVMGNAVNGMESFATWQHLALAGFIEGSYTGAISGANAEAPGINTPVSKVPNATFLMLYALPTTGVSGVFAANYRHALVFGASSALAGGSIPPGPAPPYLPALATIEAMQLDQKTDDGYPGTGNLLTYTNAAAALGGTTLTCANGTTSTAAYDMTKTGNQCSLIFITGF